MTRIIQLSLAALTAATVMLALTPNTSSKAAKNKASSKTTAKKTTAKKSTVKKTTKAATPASTAKSSSAKSTAKSSTSTSKSASKTTVRRTVVPRVAVTAKARSEAHDYVLQNVADGADLPVENAVALIPFFELLYRHQLGLIPGPLRILHYGDSHTAADEWTGAMRLHFQEKFGDGGSGFSLVPGKGYRRIDVRSGATRQWHPDGLVGHAAGDGIYGLGGLSLTAVKPRESVYVQADGSDFELFYYQQPGGGTIQVYDDGMPLEQVMTNGEPGPAYYRIETNPGPHRIEVETLDRDPVRLFGFVAENMTGVTYETLGINGAQASIVLGWDEETLRSNIARRDPGLIVLAYGTNEAGRKDWTLDSYRAMYVQLIQRLRAAAPTATILVVGPPDRTQYVRGKGWATMDGIDMIAEAQRQAAAQTGCAFWDMRAKMGGKGSMLKWVSAGMAQADHVHFTAPGYRMVADALFRDLMSQYDIFLRARQSVVAEGPAEDFHEESGITRGH